MKAKTYTLLVTVSDKAPPTPEAMALLVSGYLERGAYAVKSATVHAIEGTRPLSATVAALHSAIVRSHA
jgi:hypothetical protein